LVKIGSFRENKGYTGLTPYGVGDWLKRRETGEERPSPMEWFPSRHENLLGTVRRGSDVFRDRLQGIKQAAPTIGREMLGIAPGPVGRPKQSYVEGKGAGPTGYLWW